MANKNEMLEATEIDNQDSFDFIELENKLQNDLEVQLSELEFLKEYREKIGDPESLGKTVLNIVWEQFIDQIATTAGEDFIKENRGLRLDLRSGAHIQTTENFEEGKIADHNNKIKFQKRYDDWQADFQRGVNGEIKTKYDKRSCSEQKVLTKDARKRFDINRDTGSTRVHKDHTVSAAEIIRDSQANTHVDRTEQEKFANGDKNLKDLDAAANQSKGDSKMNNWLNTERKGEKPAERFNIDEEKLKETDRIAREAYEKLKKEGEHKSIETGKQSQKEEAFRITGKALRTVVIQLFAELIKKIISKLILWFKEASRNTESLFNYIKSALSSFISELKKHLVNAGSAIITTVITAIYGPVVRTIKKALTMFKQGWRTLKEAIDFIKRPDNKNEPIERLILETGKIIIVGLSATGAIVLGEVIEKGLMVIPVFAFEIAGFGSLASLMGLFMGGLVAGIVGAIAISLINKVITKQQKSQLAKQEIKKGNAILSTQNDLIALKENELEYTRRNIYTSLATRHNNASKIIKEVLENISSEDVKSKIVSSDNEDKFDEMDEFFKKIRE